MTLRELIAAGPQWEMAPPVEINGKQVHEEFKCVCGATTWVDAKTGLCQPCWRIWRFCAEGAAARHGGAGDPRTPSPGHETAPPPSPRSRRSGPAG